jgi:cysteine desulfurase / selenocysteine lyase
MTVSSGPTFAASIRDDFPILRRRVQGRPAVYLDSAATTLKPLPVLDAERDYSLNYCANIHRGNHLFSEEASEAYEDARRAVGHFIGAGARQVVFVRNATEALNMVASGLRASGVRRVSIPTGEHHSNIVPWMRAAQVEWIDHDPREPLDIAALEAHLRRTEPDLLTFSHASNVTGVINPVAEICALAGSLGVKTCVDASQAVAHLPVDISALGCDYLAFSGHKMMGPTGIGVLAGRLDALERLEPLLLGGGAVREVTLTGYSLKDIPHRLEAGTPNISGAIGLGAAVGYLRGLMGERMTRHHEQLADRLEAVLSGIPGVRLLQAKTGPRLPLASLLIGGGLGPANLGSMLSDCHGVMVRAGHHCAHPLFKGIDAEKGALRASAYAYNEVAEIDYLGDCILKLLRRFGG